MANRVLMANGGLHLPFARYFAALSRKGLIETELLTRNNLCCLGTYIMKTGSIELRTAGRENAESE